MPNLDPRCLEALLLDALANALSQAKLAPDARVWVAFSGGMDSMALAHCCMRWRMREQNHVVKLVHVDHGLQAQSAAWAQHCVRFAETCDLAIELLQVDLPKTTGNLEARARQARFAVIAGQLAPNDVLLVAHHANDQAETMLMKLMRGDGARGMAGMRADTRLFGMRVLRPWLGQARADVLAYAQSQNLTWISDPMNHDLRFKRTQIREQLMPILQAIAPDAVLKMAAAALQLQADRAVVEQQNRVDLAACLGQQADTLNLLSWRQFDRPRRAEILRTWLHQVRLFQPEAVQRVVQFAEANAVTGSVKLAPDRTLFRVDDALCLQTNLPVAADWHAQWLTDEALQLPGHLGQLALQPSVQGHHFDVRFRLGGERIKLPGRTHHHAVKDLLQAAAIPPWRRKQLIIITFPDDGAVACVLGVAQSARFVDWLAQHQTGLVHNQ